MELTECFVFGRGFKEVYSGLQMVLKLLQSDCAQLEKTTRINERRHTFKDKSRWSIKNVK